MKPKVLLLCGLTGSGKTTLARQLETEHNAVRFSPDEWMLKLYGAHMSRELFDQRLETCRELILETAERILTVGVSVVLDFGLWKRAERAKMKAWLDDRGHDHTLYFLDLPQDELWRRLEQRNGALDKGTFAISREMLELFSSWFESPTANEGFKLVKLEASGKFDRS